MKNWLRMMAIAAMLVAVPTVVMAEEAAVTAAVEEMTVEGTISKIDSSWVIISTKAADETVSEVVIEATADTKFDEGKTLADLKAGDSVAAVYEVKEGKNVAASIKTVEVGEAAEAT